MAVTSKTSRRDAAFERLLADVHKGDRGATDRLVEQYSPNILRSARAHLHLSNVRQETCDAFDILQLTWLFALEHPYWVGELTSEEQLLDYLSKVVRNTVTNESRRQRRQKRTATELRFDALSEEEQPKSKTERPSQRFAAQEWFLNLIEGKPEHYQKVVRMRALGHSNQEIADEIGVNARTVLKILEKFFKDLD